MTIRTVRCRTPPNEGLPKVLTARAHYAQVLADTDAAMPPIRTPAPGTETVLITNAEQNAVTALLTRRRGRPRGPKPRTRRSPPGCRSGTRPGQQVLDTETKLLSHAIRMAAFNTASTLAREIRTDTGYARADEEAHALIRQALTASGDIDTSQAGYLTIGWTRYQPPGQRRQSPNSARN